MSEASFNPESAELAHQFSQGDALAELLESCAPHQRALLSVLAVSDRYNIDPVPLLSGLAQELSTADGARVEELAEQMSGGIEAVDALDQIPNLIPPSGVVALQLARSEGNLSTLYASLLSRHAGNEPVASIHDDNYVPRLAWMAVYAMGVASVIMFILLKIVPEFQKMLEEFGIESPPVFMYFLRISDTTAKLWFVPFFLLLCLSPLCVPVFRRYLHRWSPLKWRQQLTPSAVNRRRTLASLIQSAAPWQYAVARIPGSVSLYKIFPRLLKAIARIKNDQGEWESLSAEKVITKRESQALALTKSGETQAWLLRWFAADLKKRQANRSSIWFRWLMITAYFAISFFVVLAVFAIFMTYLKIVADV